MQRLSVSISLGYWELYTLDLLLKFESHIRSVVASVSSRLGILRKTLGVFDDLALAVSGATCFQCLNILCFFYKIYINDVVWEVGTPLMGSIFEYGGAGEFKSLINRFLLRSWYLLYFPSVFIFRVSYRTGPF